MGELEIEQLRAGFEAWSRGDLEGALDGVDPEFELNDHIVPEDSTTTRGPNSVIANLRNVREAFEEMTLEPLEFVDLGDCILVRVRAFARAVHTGLEFDMEVGHVWAYRDGRATRLDVYPSWDEARRAAGLENA